MFKAAPIAICSANKSFKCGRARRTNLKRFVVYCATFNEKHFRYLYTLNNYEMTESDICCELSVIDNVTFIIPLS